MFSRLSIGLPIKWPGRSWEHKVSALRYWIVSNKSPITLTCKDGDQDDNESCERSGGNEGCDQLSIIETVVVEHTAGHGETLERIICVRIICRLYIINLVLTNSMNLRTDNRLLDSFRSSIVRVVILNGWYYDELLPRQWDGTNCWLHVQNHTDPDLIHVTKMNLGICPFHKTQGDSINGCLAFGPVIIHSGAVAQSTWDLTETQRTLEHSAWW